MENPGSQEAPPPIPVLSKPEIAKKAEEVVRHEFRLQSPKRQYRKSNKPRVPVTWRTKPDPFEEMNADIELMLRLDPKQTSRQLFNALSAKYLEKVSMAQYRTLQRRLKAWRKSLAPSELTVSIYSAPEIQLEIDQLILQALERSPKLKHLSTNFNESTNDFKLRS